MLRASILKSRSCVCPDSIHALTRALDHCHETGKFRGWVCSGCNAGHGIMDNIERLEKRIAFLKRTV